MNLNEAIEAKIEETLINMQDLEVGSNEYLTAAKAVAVLSEARANTALKLKGISVDTLIAVGANLAGILLVINHERINVITTKAFGMIWKGR